MDRSLSARTAAAEIEFPVSVQMGNARDRSLTGYFSQLTMTGGAFFAPAADNDEEYEMGPVGETHAVQWIGTAGVKGPKWARLPLLTVGMLGIQVSFAL